MPFTTKIGEGDMGQVYRAVKSLEARGAVSIRAPMPETNHEARGDGSMSEEKRTIDRRRLVKLIGAAGATATVASACRSSLEGSASAPANDALTERLDRLEAERAIVATLSAYGHALDYGDRDQFLGCFTKDAAYVVAMRIDTENGFEFHGHDELTGYFDNHTHAPAAWHKHITTNSIVTVDGDQATANSYFVRVDASAEAGAAFIVASGRYLDELVRDATGNWRIRSRRCEVENL